MSENIQRVLYKVSGEVLMGGKPYGQDAEAIKLIAQDIKEVFNLGKDLCIVVGGGNIFRGVMSRDSGMDRVTGDYIGMLATVMNALALQSVIESFGIETRVMSAVRISSMCEEYIRRRAIRHISKRRIVIFAAGTGNPFFTTDTAAVLRAVEMGCHAVIKGTSVDGIYSDDPKKNPDAKRYNSISYDDVINQRLRVMDLSAVTLAKDNNMPIYITQIKNKVNPLLNTLQNLHIASKISD